ncbi:MtrB/PioB family outer membrane beta-barrel protein, partial [Trichloromonas sp.]|uniref:MtrB/PioB family outer membrane beta-barrel protein n=1 Tax=Trichloromonas sp. TaxID=3069249 RepID=UPI003D8175F5
MGYRSVSTADTAHRAAPYSVLKSGPTAEFELKYLNPSLRFLFLGTYLDDADYLVESDFDYKGLLRIKVETEKFIHNLDNISYNRPAADNDATAPDLIDFIDRSARNDYFVNVEIDKVSMKAKLPDYPAHLTLGYWRLERSGKKQLRYLNEGGDAACSQCHMESKSQDIDRVTEEFTIGLDTHFGYLNLAVEQLFREFHDRESAPFDAFGSTDNLFGAPVRDPGFYRHDATPDSRLVSTTIKASTSPSGGVVAAAGFTVGKKENLTGSGLGVSPVESETDFRKASADLTLIPTPKLTLNFRYRMLDQDNSNSSQISVAGLDPADVAVRNNIDFTRATYNAKASYRPLNRLTLMGEFERREIHRSQTGPAFDDPFDPFWELPEDENINRYRLSFIARPLGPSSLKINAWYEYLTSDDPAYGASVEEQQQVFAGVNWTPSARFGATANLRLSRGINSNFERSEYSGGTLYRYDIDRYQRQEDFTLGLWSQLTDALNINLHYGFLRSDTSQDVMFGAAPDPLIN